mmetsp:Transcript_5775/g.9583  ORF Transcript_5775/g.9583 Transcript_5775/m.9583 type:complete len:177 (+) Transcript_5775:146-676(+)|eukprot:CAMPEP_0119002850 /NCGR_PEP_ID=MMETSP1176-20130426/181_1 /TAXON_ID=265551 /ORGANISM="Synedropsis recta cf, Strain CCMP1620" /LENGTH=176 /DNA_ID=CAMNT_0006954381 /DNA_START=70 /DNA_END=600 /DNA_ORIENTATION=+
MPVVPTESGQDWGSVNAGKGIAKRYSVPTTGRELDWAKKTGKVVTEKRYGAGGNASSMTTSMGMNARKLEESTEVGSIAKVDGSLSKAIMQARKAKKMTQQQLATAMSEKLQVVKDYENKKATPNQSVINKFQRALGTKLPAATSKSKIIGGKSGSGTAGKKAPSTVTRGGPAKRR